MEDAARYNIALPAPAPTPDYELWLENIEAVATFLRCDTQWRMGPGGVIGLDFNVVLAMASLYSVDEPTRLVEDLKLMEARALQLFREAADKQAKAASKRGRR